MTSQPYRTEEGGRIDRSRRLRFRFDGRTLTGHPGDTLASALLANGVHLAGRSFKYHRPRGIMAAGVEEPNALVQLEDGGGRTDPNIRATQLELRDGLTAFSQNRWPSLGFDTGAVADFAAPLLPAGFYYKTFKWPGAAWRRLYEPVIRRMAGMGTAPREPDPDRYAHCFAHCDVLVAGAGPAGLAAALAAGRSGARVIIADEQAEPGGSLLAESARTQIGGGSAEAWLSVALEQLAAMPDVRILPRTTVFGYYDHNMVCLLERVTDHLPPADHGDLPRQRLWKVRAKQVVLATGAIERPLVFHKNDRPGIMLASAARTYLNRYGVRVGGRALVATNNDSAYAAALDLRDAGIEIAAIADLREEAKGDLPDEARARGITVLEHFAVVGTEGRRRVHAANVMPLDESGARVVGSATAIPCDVLLMSGGWNPTVHLFSQSRGRLAFDDGIAGFVPGTSAQAETSAGACRGSFSLAACLAEGGKAGAAAARAAGLKARAPAAPKVEEPGEGPIRPVWLIPSDRPAGRMRAFVDFQNDVTAKDLKLALTEGYSSIEHVKRYTTTGMGTDQGKTSNVNALAIVAGTLGSGIDGVGTTTFRPPYTPVTFGAFAGPNRRDLFDPVRKTPTHAWAEANGAAFEDVGQWKRAWYFPKPGEDMHAAVQRECRAARTDIGIMDASTLGKIDIQGPDAVELLMRVYTNAWQKLEVGRCRYGLMLGEDGMVIDDGVTARLGEHRFHMTTTTGNAARVLAWLEEWVQTEWPDLRVHMTSVTEQWAALAVCGPKARDLLATLCTDIDLEAAAFPHMSVREATVAGLPARIFRVSFTGEQSFEINVPWSYGAALWEALIEAGQAFGITPFGTESMHVLRAEKGYIIVGQETDGTITPVDLGMDWIVSKQKDFIGRRSLFRSDIVGTDRKQLVGLLTEDPAEVLEEGAQIVAGIPDDRPPRPIGHVTSSYMSPNLGRSIALALVEGGRDRDGARLLVPLENRVVAAEVTSPVFFDPDGERLRA